MKISTKVFNSIVVVLIGVVGYILPKNNSTFTFSVVEFLAGLVIAFLLAKFTFSIWQDRIGTYSRRQVAMLLASTMFEWLLIIGLSKWYFSDHDLMALNATVATAACYVYFIVFAGDYAKIPTVGH